MTFVDLDESTNRIAVGIESASVAAAVMATAAASQVPSAGIAIEMTGPLQIQESISDAVRPLVGGIVIHPSGCTFGFNAIWEGYDVWLTNSHCSDIQYSTDSGIFFQHGEDIGQEFYDPPSRECPSWFPYLTDQCRWSDSTIIRSRSGPAYGFAEIARTTFRGQNGASGSFTIDSSNPRFSITSEIAAPMGGARVDKIGLGTGWTTGFVTGTCVDTDQIGSSVGLICQYLADYGNTGGDSGSPVFEWSGTGSSVGLTGIHWGGFADGRGVFSPMGGIQEDLCQFLVCHPITVTFGEGGGGGGGGECSPEEITC